jgi:hypothetical protein
MEEGDENEEDGVEEVTVDDELAETVASSSEVAMAAADSTEIEENDEEDDDDNAGFSFSFFFWTIARVSASLLSDPKWGLDWKQQLHTANP